MAESRLEAAAVSTAHGFCRRAFGSSRDATIILVVGRIGAAS